jgi:hypothetical protein
MTLKEILKDMPDIYKQVEEAVNASGAKLVDLNDGGYVAKKKYDDKVTELDNIKNAPNPLQKELDDLKEENSKNLETEKKKLSTVAIKLATDNVINGLGISDKLTLEGIKALISTKSDSIKVDDNYNVSGLDDVVNSIKETYADSFKQPHVVSTGQVIDTSKTTGGNTGRVYKSLDEIKGLSRAEIQADYKNIISQLNGLE